MKSKNTTFAQIGEVFDDATTRLVGGVNDQNRDRILSDLDRVQSGLETLLQNHPEQFEGVAAIHAQNIVDQLNLEIRQVKVGDPFSAKYINDVQRDLIDIVQGDDVLAAMANSGRHHGFEPVPDLLVPPAQFQGNPEQVAFMKGFIVTTQGFADRATALANDVHADPAAVSALVSDIQAYGEMANAFTRAQGGLYSARFNNEFADNGVNGTASRAMIHGLQTGDAKEVAAAAEVMTANSMDVASNMLGVGADRANTGNGIPDHITTVAQAGVVFNDATTKLIGGVHDGNRQSLHDDLSATKQGLQDMVDQGQFAGGAQARVNKIVDLLGREIAIVDDPNADKVAATELHQLHTKVISLVQGNATLSAAADVNDANGFMQLPNAQTKGHHNGSGIGNGSGSHGDAMTIAQADDPMGHIFSGTADHHIV